MEILYMKILQQSRQVFTSSYQCTRIECIKFKSTPVKVANIYRVKVWLLLKRYRDCQYSYFQKARHKRDISKHLQETSVCIPVQVHAM